MAIPNADHLFAQADRLIAPPPAGPPRQVDLRRAISAAYYGLFHFTMMSVANEFVGAEHRAKPRYALVYRSLDHRLLKEICAEARKQTPSARYAPFVPPGGFGPDILVFSTLAIDLQERRVAADYNPQARFKTSDSKAAIDAARNAVQRLTRAVEEHRKGFLTLLLCPPR